jgi:hypothetical protein
MRIPLPTECRSVRRECQSPWAPCWLASDLHALGWREGENLQIEIRSSNDELASLPRIAADTERCAVAELLGVDAAAINPHPAAWVTVQSPIRCRLSPATLHSMTTSAPIEELGLLEESRGRSENPVD